MDFYWEEIQEHEYVIYMKGYVAVLGTLWFCEDCGLYHFESEWFMFDKDYDCEELNIDDEEELKEIIKIDLIENMKLKIKYMIEQLCSLGKM